MPTYCEPWPGNTKATARPANAPCPWWEGSGKGWELPRLGDRNLSFHVVPGFADRTQLLSILIGDLHPVLLLEGHDQLDQVEGVRLQVFGEGGFRCYLLDVDTKLLRDDAAEFVETRLGHPSLLRVLELRAPPRGDPKCGVYDIET